ncbi:MAG: outer membrane beta-barrel protein [Bacteroidales bacterium]|nr:outer membrane beta-barrel protein [Bacteroidales bacterium]
MKKQFTLLALICCFSIATQAQSKTGTFGLQVEAGYAFAFSGATRPKAIDGELDKAWSIAVSPGYHVTDKLFAGLGVDLYNYGFNYNELSEGMLDIQSSFFAIPIYAHGMWKFRGSEKPSFFVSLKAGYGIISKSMYPMRGIGGLEDYENHYSGGLYVSPSIGFIYPLNYKNSLSLSVSYDLQQNKEELVDTRMGIPKGKEDRDNYTLALKVGWAF